MNVEVCEYLICGDGYFDFAGRDGLLKTIKKIVPNGHWLPTTVGDAAYNNALKKLSALRNFAAHDSSVSKKRALEALGQESVPDLVDLDGTVSRPTKRNSSRSRSRSER